MHSDIYKRVKRVYEVLNFITDMVKPDELLIAYSGGKDSSALTLLVLEWLVNSGNDSHVEIFHNDTFVEIPEMEVWARFFMSRVKDIARSNDLRLDYRIVSPEPRDTFYYLVIVRGYPPPTFKFRWCTWVLKRKPTIKYLEKNKINKKILVLLGSRDIESFNRKTVLKKRGMGEPGKGLEYYLLSSDDYYKATPIRDWNDNEVWNYLYMMNNKYHGLLNELFHLYNDKTIRYGCWFCTLIKTQKANMINDKYKYYEVARLIYKNLSNKKFRLVRKTSGNWYSKLSGLNKYARSIVYWLIKAVEELSNQKFYGLDESHIEEYSLRELFYELDPHISNEIISSYDRRFPRKIVLDADFYTVATLSKNELQPHMNELRSMIETDLSNYDPGIKDYVEDVFAKISEYLK